MKWQRLKTLASIRSSLFQLRTVSHSYTRAMSTKTYQEAVEHLNSLQSNAATLEAVRVSGGRSSEFAIPEMLEYLDRIGYTPEQLNSLNVIHITGTKGKGSTSAFTESIIRHAKPGWTTGLYTSPHLVAVRERIRINGVPISEAEFAKYFFEVWDMLIKNNKMEVPTTPPMPGYFRFVTLMAFHVFMQLKVDATVLEVGVGGTYDSTNIVPSPVVTGITALGIDHVNVLGRTLTEIAWQKGGIFKNGVPAFTVQQPQEGMTMLESRAKELKAAGLKVVDGISELSGLKLGLSGNHQVQNAGLAVELARSFLQSKEPNTIEAQGLPNSFEKGLVETRWPGRCQTVVDPKREKVTWYLDGAHTVESLQCCVQWFVAPEVGISAANADEEEASRVLIFNCTSGRSGDSFLGTVREGIRSQLALHKRDGDDITGFFSHVIFCANVTYADGHFKGDLTSKAISESDLAELKTQQALALAWSSLFPSYPANRIYVLPSIEDAVKVVEGIQRPVKALVAGSLHLVGGVVEVAGLSEVVL